ncbi:transcriptional regulator [Clostridia bacterium]|nr:transcriptional regulator [Clostridia bacterium]
MPLPIALQEILMRNYGVITTAQANSIGVSNERLRLLANAGELERVLHGVYISPDEFVDKMYVAQLRRPKIIYSHETALFLHDLTDRDPISYTVTVPTGYSAVRLRGDGLNVFTVKRVLHEMGATRAKTVFGHIVTVYGLERTICDCIRSRNQMDIAVVTDAMKRYAKRSDKNLNTLMEMAEAFRVTKLLGSYMEVLL